MTFIAWVDSKIRRFRWYDILMIKIAAASFALMVAKFWPPLLSLDWQAYLVIIIIAAALVFMRMMHKNAP